MRINGQWLGVSYYWAETLLGKQVACFGFDRVSLYVELCWSLCAVGVYLRYSKKKDVHQCIQALMQSQPCGWYEASFTRTALGFIMVAEQVDVTP